MTAGCVSCAGALGWDSCVVLHPFLPFGDPVAACSSCLQETVAAPLSRSFSHACFSRALTWRLQETQRLIAEPVAGISATPYQDNLRYFAVAIEGPADSPYERGVFQLELFLPADYPMAPPKVRFLTKIYHPNVDKLGRICLDILKDKWSPALQIRTVLLSIQALLSAPNPDDPLDNTVAEVWKKNEAEAIRRAREFTESFAMKNTTAAAATAGKTG